MEKASCGHQTEAQRTFIPYLKTVHATCLAPVSVVERPIAASDHKLLSVD